MAVSEHVACSGCSRGGARNGGRRRGAWPERGKEEAGRPQVSRSEEKEARGSRTWPGRRHARHGGELPAWPRVEDDPAPGGLGLLLARLGEVMWAGGILLSLSFLFSVLLFVFLLKK